MIGIMEFNAPGQFIFKQIPDISVDDLQPGSMRCVFWLHIKIVTQVSHPQMDKDPKWLRANGLFRRRNNNAVVPKIETNTNLSEPGTMENRDDAPRLLAQARRFVNLFCAVLRAAVIIYFAFKIPHPPVTVNAILYDRGAKFEYITEVGAMPRPGQRQKK